MNIEITTLKQFNQWSLEETCKFLKSCHSKPSEYQNGITGKGTEQDGKNDFIIIPWRNIC